jgi:hypothetical protein
MRTRGLVGLLPAVLLALLLPLQSLAGVSGCASHGLPHTHCPDQAKGGGELHGCGSCCQALLAAALPSFAPPRAEADVLVLPVSSAPRDLAPDRLDRPPRITP